jgi:hypothetical protein
LANSVEIEKLATQTADEILAMKPYSLAYIQECIVYYRLMKRKLSDDQKELSDHQLLSSVKQEVGQGFFETITQIQDAHKLFDFMIKVSVAGLIIVITAPIKDFLNNFGHAILLVFGAVAFFFLGWVLSNYQVPLFHLLHYRIGRLLTKTKRDSI